MYSGGMRRERRTTTWAWLAVMTSATAGCGIIGPKTCTSDLRWRVSHTEVALPVGGTVRVSAEAFGCGGTEDLPVDMRWTSSNEDVVVVGERDGRVVARAVGTAEIIGTDEHSYRIGPFRIGVTVEDSTPP